MTNELFIGNWIHNTNKNSVHNNLSIRSDELYSYNSLLARKRNNSIEINKSTANYSTTSRKHAAILYRYTSITYNFENPSKSLEDLASLVLLHKRARKRSYYRSIAQALTAISYIHKQVEPLPYTPTIDEAIMICLENGVQSIKYPSSLVDFSKFETTHPEFFI